MKKVIIGVVLLIVAVVAICLWQQKNAANTNGSTVVVGVIAGTTGTYAAAGEGYVKGFELAREEWNKNHSLQFQAIIEDDGFNAQKGVAAYNKLKSADSVAVYAILSTFTIDAIAKQLKTEGKPVVLGFEQSTPAEADVIFQILPAARPIQKALGEHLKKLGYKKPVVLVSNNTPVYENFAAGFLEGYGPRATKEVVTGDVAGSRVLATKVLAEKYDVVVFFVAPKDGAILAKEIVTQAKGSAPKFAFDQSIQSGIQDYKKVLGETLSPLDDSFVALSRNDLTEDFKKLYQEKYQAEPPFGADMGYNTFTLLAETYSASSEKWVKNMQSARLSGADGEVRFDAAGLRIPNAYFAELKGGEVVVK